MGEGLLCVCGGLHAVLRRATRALPAGADTPMQNIGHSLSTA